MTDIFDARWSAIDGGHTAGVLNFTVSGDHISIERTGQVGWGSGRCRYDGTISRNGHTITGDSQCFQLQPGPLRSFGDVAWYATID